MKINWSTISLKDLAGFVSKNLKDEGLDAILVGGACVTIYSKNRYQSFDLDFVTYDEMKKVATVLKKIGFEKKHKYFSRSDCQWFIEFVSPPIAVGDEPITKFHQVKTPLGTIKLLLPVDTVKDRLAAFYYWNDKQGLQQAIMICKNSKIDLKEIERWSKHENQIDKFEIFKSNLEKT